MGVMVWGPLNSGWLTGKYDADATPAGSRAERWARGAERFDPARDAVQRKHALVALLLVPRRDERLGLLFGHAFHGSTQ